MGPEGPPPKPALASWCSGLDWGPGLTPAVLPTRPLCPPSVAFTAGPNSPGGCTAGGRGGRARPQGAFLTLTPSVRAAGPAGEHSLRAPQGRLQDGPVGWPAPAEVSRAGSNASPRGVSLMPQSRTRGELATAQHQCLLIVAEVAAPGPGPGAAGSGAQRALRPLQRSPMLGQSSTAGWAELWGGARHSHGQPGLHLCPEPRSSLLGHGRGRVGSCPHCWDLLMWKVGIWGEQGLPRRDDSA